MPKPALFLRKSNSTLVNSSEECPSQLFLRKSDSTLVNSSARLQGSLILRHGIFIRGGITVGPVARTYRQLFGQGVIDAYNLETRAIQPRVMVDPALLADVGQNTDLCVNNCRQERRIVESLLRFDSGASLSYVDYLREMHGDPWPDHVGKTFADAHAANIEEELLKHDGNLRVRSR